MKHNFIQKKSSNTTKKDREIRYAKTNERIATILSRLYAGETLSMEELANEFGKSLRTIQRDVNERLIGFPIKKKGDRFSLNWIEQGEMAFSEEEVAVIELLEEMSKKQGIDFYHKAHNLLKKIKTTTINPFYAKLDMEDIGDKLFIATKIEKAIKQKQIVSCRYKMDNNIYDTEIKPLKIANFEGFWYVIAIDNRDNIVKKYLLRNISNISIKDKIFEVSDELEEKVKNAISVWFDTDKEPFEVRLFISNKVAKYFKVKPICKSQSIEGVDSDGSMEVVLKITHEMEIIPIVKYWLPHIRVLEPSWIDKMVKENIKGYLSN